MGPLYDHPAWSVTLNGQDMTGTLKPRLVRLTVTECRSEDLDQLDIELSDYDGQLAIPEPEASITVAIGWKQGGMIDKGKFIVDEIEHSGTPDVLILRARSADLLADMRIRAEHSYHDMTVGAIIGQIAGRHGLTPVVGPAGGEHIEHIDQTDSDIAFLKRLGRRFDQVATVKDGNLLFLPASEATSASGQGLTPATIARADGDRHRYHVAGRDTYTGVRAYWHDIKKAERQSVLVGGGGNAKRLRDTFANEKDALAEAEAEWGRIQRGAATLAFSLARGRPEIGPQTPVTVVGLKAPIETTPWLVKRASHVLDGQGLRTDLEMETHAG